MKRRNKKVTKKTLFLMLGLLIILSIPLICYLLIFTTTFKSKLKEIEVGKSYKISDIVSIKNGKIMSNDKIKIDTIGKEEIVIKYKDIIGKNKEYKLKINVVDKEKPKINVPDNLSFDASSSSDLLEVITGSDNYDKEVDIKVEGEYNLKKKGSYKVVLVATDSSGNKQTKEVTINVTEKETKKEVVNSNSKYYVKVNKTLNVMMVYSKDEKGEYNKLVQTFLVSTGGANTPNGVFKTGERVEMLSLVGNVWGHYTLRITGPIWFHSVPYFSKPKEGLDGNVHWDDLEYEEFNKLGTTASAGCVRLSTIDAKWVYENLGWQTPVEIYESDELPMGVQIPSAIKIDVNSPNKGWDPTDPDPANPWR